VSAIALVAVGGAAAVWGTLATASPRRRLALVGALVAPLGVLVAALGGAWLCAPRLFG
jgi:hypothetical protein